VSDQNWLAKAKEKQRTTLFKGQGDLGPCGLLQSQSCDVNQQQSGCLPAEATVTL
jgi:hypothetical protein